MNMETTARFLGDEGHPASLEQSRLVVLPVPYEGTVSYGKGTGLAPQAILAASGQLEMYDEELDCCPDRHGIYTLPPLPPADSPKAMIDQVAQAVEPLVRQGKIPFVLGGEHSISGGAFRGVKQALGRPFSILQIDAHADLRQSYTGGIYSHASVMARAHDLGLPFVQVAIRAISQEERAFMREQKLEQNVFWGHQVSGPDEGWIERAASLLGPEVYVTFDIDGLDPSLAPHTGTPVPGGLGWYPALRLLRRAMRGRRVVGLDLMEASAGPDSRPTDFLAARLAYKMMAYALEG